MAGILHAIASNSLTPETGTTARSVKNLLMPERTVVSLCGAGEGHPGVDRQGHRAVVSAAVRRCALPRPSGHRTCEPTEPVLAGEADKVGGNERLPALGWLRAAESAGRRQHDGPGSGSARSAA